MGAPASFPIPFMGARVAWCPNTRLEKQDDPQEQETAVYSSQIFRSQAKVARGSISRRDVPDAPKDQISDMVLIRFVSLHGLHISTSLCVQEMGVSP